MVSKQTTVTTDEVEIRVVSISRFRDRVTLETKREINGWKPKYHKVRIDEVVRLTLKLENELITR